MLRSVITGTGCCIPTQTKTNPDFLSSKFYAEDRSIIKIEPKIIIDKFQKITGIAERRYVSDDLNTSDIATIAAQEAINDSGIDMETLDMIIVAQNFGNVIKNTIQTDAVPALASRVKHNLRIKNPSCIAYDILFGCPGWIQGIIQADAFFKAGLAKKALVIGAETLSRVIDNYDRDSMIFSDGAGATIVEYKEVRESGSGILSSCSLSHCLEEAYYINMDASYYPESDSKIKYIKMKGRKVYEYALKHVPEAMKACLDQSGVDIMHLKKIFIHQANEKMDEAIVQAMYKLFGYTETPKDIMPMCIQYLGNSSVATVPTLYDIVLKGKDLDHSVNEGDVILFASVGAGMNINAVCYRI
ncbi:ketoacyl-ACP synthase III [Chitinophagaceae bacterium LB-8]|uniref:Ketoacyl-ACP synthase III n=1 Tax=Paraflavisolibacter caeni TaxID=2982496 RepID=A0A9X3BAK8_9BACT|nr:ketoacyl-ACP synthase III [Paraflavisolibacter caeni]MCU7552936.1 ketoacyl-ACP synthase III [Paraflavisolibacter caeni]